MGVEGQSLTEEDQLYILIQAALNITAIRESAPEAKICYERAESLCRSVNRPLLLYVALMGQWRYCVVTHKVAAAMPLAKRLYSLAQEQNDSTLMIGACTAAGGHLYYLGDFETARQYTTRALQIWRSGGVKSPFQEVNANLSLVFPLGPIRVAFRRARLQPCDDGRSDRTSERAE